MLRNRLLNLYARNAKKGSGILNEGNIVYLYDYIAGSESEAEWWGGVSAEGFSKQLASLSGDVTVRIDSPGGDVFGGRAIAQAIRDYPGNVICQIDGLAASAASYIAIAGDSVVAAPGSFMMIHRAWTLSIGNCSDLRSTADLLEKIDGTIADSYTAKAGGNATDWLDLMTAETWFTAAEALGLGLIDGTLPEKVDKSGENIAMRPAWDLSAFSAPPEEALRETVFPEDQEQQENPEIAARRRSLMVDLLLRPA